MKKLAGSALLVAVMLGGFSAVAQERLGHQGQFIISAERLSGFYWGSRTSSLVNGNITTDTTDSGTTLQLLFPTSNLDNFGTIPRLAADVAVINGLTIGGSVGYAHISGSKETSTNGVSNTVDSGSLDAFTIASRVGYMLMFTDKIGFWPRAGFSYTYATQTAPIDNLAGTVTASISSFGGNVDALFVFSPVQHFMITAGPVFDIGFTGNRHYEVKARNTGNVTSQPDVSVHSYNIGLALGLATCF